MRSHRLAPPGIGGVGGQELVWPAGDAAALVELGTDIDPRLNARVHALRGRWRRPSRADQRPAYAALLVTYDPRRSTTRRSRPLREAVAALPARPRLAGRRRRAARGLRGRVRARSGERGRAAGAERAEVVRLHGEPSYRVYMSGSRPATATSASCQRRWSCRGWHAAQARSPRLGGHRGAASRASTACPRRRLARARPHAARAVRRRARPTPAPRRGRQRALRARVRRALRAPGRPRPPRPTARARRGCAAGSGSRRDLATSVQDLGALGYARYGVPTAGAMDPFAARAANALVGNAPGAAVLEITLAGPTLRFHAPALMAVTGADLAPQLDGAALPGWTAVPCAAGATPRFGARRAGLRAYLAVAGGIAVPPVLGSRATYARGPFGGYQGRALRAGDRLPLGPARFPLPPTGRALPPERRPGLRSRRRGARGAWTHAERFTDAGAATLLSATYTVRPDPTAWAIAWLGRAWSATSPPTSSPPACRSGACRCLATASRSCSSPITDARRRLPPDRHRDSRRPAAPRASSRQATPSASAPSPWTRLAPPTSPRSRPWAGSSAARLRARRLNGSLMQRIAVVGVTGSAEDAGGRARAAARLRLGRARRAVLGARWTPAPLEVFRARVAAALSGDRWVVDGNYQVVRDLVWGRADTVIWLDYPLAVILPRLVRRTFQRWWRREVLWQGQPREPGGAFPIPRVTVPVGAAHAPEVPARVRRADRERSALPPDRASVSGAASDRRLACFDRDAAPCNIWGREPLTGVGGMAVPRPRLAQETG